MSRYAFLKDNIVANVVVAEESHINSLDDSADYIPCIFCNIGDTYVDGVFVRPKMFASWVLNSDNEWEAPTPIPTDTVGPYYWDESLLKWVSRA